MTKKIYVPVRFQDDILVRVKKMAGDQGRSVSETVGILVGKSLESGSNSGLGIDPEIIRKELEPVLKALTFLTEIAGLSKGLDPDPVKNGPVSAPEVRPELVRFLAEKSARTDALLEEVASKITGKSVEVLRDEITEELSKRSDPVQGVNASNWIRDLIEKTARIDALLIGVSVKISGSAVGDHSERMRRANIFAGADIKNLFGG